MKQTSKHLAQGPSHRRGVTRSVRAPAGTSRQKWSYPTALARKAPHGDEEPLGTKHEATEEREQPPTIDQPAWHTPCVRGDLGRAPGIGKTASETLRRRERDAALHDAVCLPAHGARGARQHPSGPARGLRRPDAQAFQAARHLLL